MTEIISPKIHRLEGFFDTKCEGDDHFGCFLMEPVMQQWMPSSTNIDSEIEDVGISLSLGETLYDESQFLSPSILRKMFRQAKAAFEANRSSRLLYFCVEMEVFGEESEEVFRIVSYIGAPQLDVRPTFNPTSEVSHTSVA